MTCSVKLIIKKLLRTYNREFAEWKKLVSIVFTVCRDYECRSVKVQIMAIFRMLNKQRNIGFGFFFLPYTEIS